MIGPSDTMDKVIKRLDADVDRLKAQGLQAVAIDTLVGEARRIAVEAVQDASRALHASNSAELTAIRAEVTKAAQAIGDQKLPERLERTIAMLAAHGRDVDELEAKVAAVDKAAADALREAGGVPVLSAKVDQLAAAQAELVGTAREARAQAARAESYAREVAEQARAHQEEISARVNSLAQRVAELARATAARPAAVPDAEVAAAADPTFQSPSPSQPDPHAG